MGQRLNISMEKDGQVVANCYYHWSAYTGSAALLVRQICEAWDEAKAVSQSDLEFACRLLQKTGAGFNPEEIERIRFQRDERVNTFPLWPSVDRSDGLISATREGIEETERYEEGRVTIDLDSESVDFGVACWTYADEYREELEEDPNDLPRLDRDPTEGLTVRNFEDFVDFLTEARSFDFYIPGDDVVFQLIA